MNNLPPLHNKTILVVGGAGRIGLGIVKSALVAGANVMALDRDINSQEALRESVPSSGGRLQTGLIDITDLASIERAFDKTDTKFGAIDGAVNTAYPRNASYGRHFFDVEYADFCDNTGVHMGGYFLFMQASARYALERQRPFSLVNLSSIYGSMAPRFDVYSDTTMTMPVEYAAIKAGLEHMTRYVNAYMKGRKSGFRANCVSPGGIFDSQDEQFLARYGEHCLTKGMLDPTDVTGAIVFLLSDASRYLAGQNLIVDDGFSI